MGIAHGLAQPQRRNRLIGGDEACEALRVHPAVAVGDRLQGNVVYAGEPSPRAVFEAGQSLGVSLRQQPFCRPNLFFDKIEVVEQPFSGRGNPAACLHGLSHYVADFKKDGFVFGKPCQQPLRGTILAHCVQGRKCPTVLLHLRSAEQVGPQRRILAGALFCERASVKDGP